MNTPSILRIALATTPSAGGFCPTPGKRVYATEQTAASSLAGIRALRATRKVPHRVYRCDCGFFHLSSAPAEA